LRFKSMRSGSAVDVDPNKLTVENVLALLEAEKLPKKTDQKLQNLEDRSIKGVALLFKQQSTTATGPWKGAYDWLDRTLMKPPTDASGVIAHDEKRGLRVLYLSMRSRYNFALKDFFDDVKTYVDYEVDVDALKRTGLKLDAQKALLHGTACKTRGSVLVKISQNHPEKTIVLTVKFVITDFTELAHNVVQLTTAVSGLRRSVVEKDDLADMLAKSQTTLAEFAKLVQVQIAALNDELDTLKAEKEAQQKE